MKARVGTAGILAGGHKLLNPPFLRHLLNTTLCLLHDCMSMFHTGQHVKQMVIMIVET